MSKHENLNRLSHTQFFRLCDALRMHVDAIDKGRMTLAQVAEFITEKVGFLVTIRNVKTAVSVRTEPAPRVGGPEVGGGAAITSRSRERAGRNASGGINRTPAGDLNGSRWPPAEPRRHHRLTGVRGTPAGESSGCRFEASCQLCRSVSDTLPGVCRRDGQEARGMS